MDEKRDEQALDWYGGRQSIVPVQSVLHERHVYLDDDEQARHRACWLLGIDDAPPAIARKMRHGGIGVVDTTTGRLVIHTADCTEFPRQTEPLAREIASLARGEREQKEIKKRGHRHAVTTGNCPFTGNTEVVLHDTSRKRHGPGGYPICRIPVDPDDETATRAAEMLFMGFARELDGHPLDWTSMRRRPEAPQGDISAPQAAETQSL